MSASGIAAGWRQWPVLAVSVLVAVALTGCFSAKDPDEHCDDVAEYQASRSASGVVVPEGLVEPSRSGGLVVPSAPADATDGSVGAPAAARTGVACLARPPDFFRKEPDPAAK